MNRILVSLLIVATATACTNNPTPMPAMRGEYQVNVVPLENLKTQAATNPSSSAFGLTQLTYTTTDTTADNSRLLTAQFKVQNNTAAPFKNLTFIAYKKDSSLVGTPFTQVLDQNGGAVANTIVSQLRPTHGNSSNLMDFQVFSSEEIASLSAQLGIPNNAALLEYGFVVRGCANASCTAFNRGLDGNGEGRLTISLRIPLASPVTNTPYRFALNFFAIDESVTRVTQALDESTAQVKSRLEGIPDRTDPAQVIFVKGESDVIPDDKIRSLHFANPKIDGNGTTMLKAAPAQFKVVAASKTSIQLSWAAVTGAVSYEIQRFSGNSSYTNYAALTSLTSGTTYLDTGLTEGTSYSYRIRALLGTDGFKPWRDTIWAENYDTPNQFTSLPQTAMEFHVRNLDFVYRKFDIYYAWLYRPSTVSSAKPLHLFHHGLGEYRDACDNTVGNLCVDKLSGNLAAGTPPKLIKDSNFRPDMFVISPQTNQSFDQPKSALFVRSVLAAASLKYGSEINSSRVSISGLSAGTGMVGSAMALYPELFAAWAIVSNRGGASMTPDQYARAAEKPSWHSANANVNNNGGDSSIQKTLIDNLLANGGSVYSSSNLSISLKYSRL